MYKHILLATDLVESNHAVIDKGKKLAEMFGAKLSLAHIVEPLPSYGYAYIGGADIESQLIEESKKSLASLGKKLGVAVENQYVEVGPTKTELLDIAEKNNVDLIVLGSHGHHGLGILLGSTANAILHGAECDVVVVRLK